MVVIESLIGWGTPRRLAQSNTSTTRVITLSELRDHASTRGDMPSRYKRLRAAGMLEMAELANQLDVTPQTILVWCRAGLRIRCMSRCLWRAA